MTALLKVDGLHVEFGSPDRPVRAVDGVSFELQRGETFALVGESGCGKSATALALLRLVEPGRITAGRIEFEGRDLMQLGEKELQRVRGGGVGLVFQEASAALNPVMRIGSQIGEALRIHRGMSRREARAEAVRLLEQVALAEPERQAAAYPHELSGGMKQRAMLAIALAGSPALLIADEPTTALDVTIQAQILDLLRDLREQLDLTILLITHDLGVVAENADRVGVMYAGRLVEVASVNALFSDPRHPYTRGLLRSMPGHVDADPGARGGAGAGRRLATLPGSVPDPADYPPGCRFHPRCSERFEPCDGEIPPDTTTPDGRRVACYLHSGTPDRPAPGSTEASRA